jgi:hypothetical protein
MTLKPYEQLKGFSYLYQDTLTDNLAWNVMEFFNWGFLQIGGFTNVNRPTSSGVYGGSKYRLRPVTDPRYSTGQVWEGFRNQWVWESGIQFQTQPIHPSGLWVNNTFYTLAQKNAYIDYPRGRIILASGISTTSVVETEFAYRTCQFVDVDNQYLQQLMFDTYRLDKDDFLSVGSGNYNTLADCRVQLPAIGIEITPVMSFQPYQIGGGQIISHDVIFYIFADNRADKRNITDIISSQNDKTFIIADKKLMKDANKFPPAINYRGELVTAPLQYPAIVAGVDENGFAWRKAYIHNTRCQEIGKFNGWLDKSVVKFTIQVIMENL